MALLTITTLENLDPGAVFRRDSAFARSRLFFFDGKNIREYDGLAVVDRSWTGNPTTEVEVVCIDDDLLRQVLKEECREVEAIAAGTQIL